MGATQLLDVQENGHFMCHHGQRQYEYVYDSNGTQAVQHILYYENLKNDFTSLMKRFNLNLTLDKKRVQIPISRGNQVLKTTDFSNMTIHAINTVYSKDFEIFGFHKRLTTL